MCRPKQQLPHEFHDTLVPRPPPPPHPHHTHVICIHSHPLPSPSLSPDEACDHDRYQFQPCHGWCCVLLDVRGPLHGPPVTAVTRPHAPARAVGMEDDSCALVVWRRHHGKATVPERQESVPPPYVGPHIRVDPNPPLQSRHRVRSVQ